MTHLLLAWVVTAASVLIAAVVVPGVSIGSTGGAVAAAPVIALFNTLLPPLAAGLRVPYTLALGFVLLLVREAAILLLVSSVAPSAIHVKSFGWALLAALVIAAAMAVLNSVLDANDD